jgi:RNA polymerase sigma factor (sigma-70 family)
LGDPNVAILQEDLRSSNAPAAWEAFLGQYSPVLYQTALAYTDDEDDAANCFLHICEQLSRNSFRRLLKFKPDGSANFTTWLRVVARNLCFDWHRTQMGRRRPFKSLQSLSSLELDVYDCRLERGLSVEETLQRLCPTSPDLDPKWLAVRPRYNVHFTPTSSSWLNQIERWFAEITRKRIRRGTFRSVRELIMAIQNYLQRYIRNPQPTTLSVGRQRKQDHPEGQQI